ncbi:MAG: ATP-binding protein [Arachnia sp.]
MSDASLSHLLARAARVEERVRGLVAQRRTDDPAPEDPFRGLYLNDEAVDRLLEGSAAVRSHPEYQVRARAEDDADRAEAAGEVLRLRQLARSASLTDFDVELLVIALLPDLDNRFERLYGYLNDDVTRRRASVGLALELGGASAISSSARGRLEPSRPLIRHGLLLVEDPERPFLGRGLRVPDRVAAHLLGDDAPDPSVAPLMEDVTPYAAAVATQLGHALASGVMLAHLRERLTGTGAAVAVEALGLAGRGTVVVDLRRLATANDPVHLVALVQREALLRGAGVVAGPIEALADAAPDGVHLLTESELPVVLVGALTWDPQWSRASPLLLDTPVLTRSERVALWEREMEAEGSGLDGNDVAGHLALGPTQIQRAVRAASASARRTGHPITGEDLRRGVRAQNAAGLERLARRIEPEVSWEDLVLAPGALRGLKEVTARARYRDTVLTDWRMRRGGGRGHGVTALFAGDSGTGKTMSAEVIAADLRLDLYTVNLATVVDKYIGETEKNLERIFVEAAGVNAVLFFDEADAIFGKRSDVRDAHDKYANIESAYLLQRLETFDGLALLATNLRANIDEAFTRRLDAIVEFPAPTPELRRSLWLRCLAPPLPLTDDVDVDFLAESFELAGGNIRSASTTAAYLAAAAGTPVGMSDVIAAVEQEYRKLGRLVLEREFGLYYALLR